ncbi:AbrB/MazE/SpoVT family DNA-binding domain-containing protein [Priestia megaterium]|uniref:AbrB/MazE/SpoVT family DNA-binding domain-containing protein n=1 Tax=Priestia megaterium TaxID=1404 RepID=UPI0027957F16|nr:AbrB/MazE/SpoVT family DNA-binding domain-containing protein [Priestia megaterium]
MKTTSITRKVDNAGRIVIPSQLRNILDIMNKDILEINTNCEQVIFKKHNFINAELKIGYRYYAIDSKGRIVIPEDIRAQLDIKNKDYVQIYVDGDLLILEKHTSKE